MFIFSAARKRAEELKAALLRERRAKAELAELSAAQRRGELILLADAQKAAFDFSARLRNILHNMLTVEAVREISALFALDNKKIAQLFEFMEQLHAQFCKEIAEGEDAPGDK